MAPAKACRSFASAMHLEFLEQIVHVVLYGCDLDSQLDRDGLVREAPVDQPDEIGRAHV